VTDYENDTVIDVIGRRPRTFLIIHWAGAVVSAFYGQDLAAFVLFILPVVLIPHALEGTTENGGTSVPSDR